MVDIEKQKRPERLGHLECWGMSGQQAAAHMAIIDRLSR